MDSFLSTVTAIVYKFAAVPKLCLSWNILLLSCDVTCEYYLRTGKKS